MNVPSSTWDQVRIVRSTCNECAVNCGSLIRVRSGIVEDVKPNPDHPGSKGAFCLKGIRGPTGLTYSDKRLLHPLRRTGERGEGKWERITWDEALDHAADRYAATRAKYGPLSLVGACNNANSGRGVAVVLLLRSLGSPNWMINQDLCGGCRAVSSRATGLDITRGEDIDNARCALVVGRNPYEADPVEWLRSRAPRSAAARSSSSTRSDSRGRASPIFGCGRARARTPRSPSP